MLKKLRTVIYHVDDLSKAKDWYAMATGVQPYFDEVYYVGFDIHGSELGLDPDMENVESGNHAVAYWAVEDIEKAVDKLLSAGASVIKEVSEVGGGIRVAVLKDPFGNAVGLIQEP